MELRVLGCHGGETPKHKTSSFLLDSTVALDAGAVTSMLTLEEQKEIETILVSHAHLDHIKDLAALADNRCQQRGPTLTIAGVAQTIEILRQHYFNDLLWPDFTKIPAANGPTIQFQELRPEEKTEVSGMTVMPIMVSHTIDTSGFLITKNNASVAYSGDTGPTDRLWEVLNATEDLRGLLMEVSFPDEEHHIAKASGHHTPESLGLDLEKLRAHRDMPVFLYHIKPVFERAVERQLCRLSRRQQMQVCRLGDHFVL